MLKCVEAAGTLRCVEAAGVLAAGMLGCVKAAGALRCVEATGMLRCMETTGMLGCGGKVTAELIGIVGGLIIVKQFYSQLSSIMCSYFFS